jgi:hypothetical protein
MSLPDDELRVRLRRLEGAMPAAVPVRAGVFDTTPGRRRPWRLLAVAAASLLLGVGIGAAGLRLLSGTAPPTGSGIPPSMHRSEVPLAGPVCVAVQMPMGSGTVGMLAYTQVWWWPQGPAGCAQRSDFVYVQWVRPSRVLIEEDGDTHGGVVMAVTVELRDGSRWPLSFTYDPLQPAGDDGVLTFRDASASVPGVRFVPIDNLDQLQEVP